VIRLRDPERPIRTASRHRTWLPMRHNKKKEGENRRPLCGSRREFECQSRKS